MRDEDIVAPVNLPKNIKIVNKTQSGGFNNSMFSATSDNFMTELRNINNQQGGSSLFISNQNGGKSINSLIDMLTENTNDNELNDRLSSLDTETDLDALMDSISELVQKGGARKRKSKSKSKSKAKKSRKSRKSKSKSKAKKGGARKRKSKSKSKAKKTTKRTSKSKSKSKSKKGGAKKRKSKSKSKAKKTTTKRKSKSKSKAKKTTTKRKSKSKSKSKKMKNQEAPKKKRKSNPGFQAFLEFKQYVAKQLGIANGIPAGKVAGAVNKKMKEKLGEGTTPAELLKANKEELDANLEKYRAML
jgi:DNA mismatch repair ATPase MutL